MMSRTTDIPHSRPALGPEDAQAVAQVVASGHVAQGAQVEAFERGVAAYVGRRGGVALSSGTAALEVALRVLGIGAGDEVLLPSFVCSAPWLAVTRIGATPRLVDCEAGTYNLDPASARHARSPKTRALIVPHLFGLPADLTAIEALGLPIIEDCAQTLGAREQGRTVGTSGVVTVCSFYATKLLCAGEGGMILADDVGVLERARMLRAYDERDDLPAASFNYKMTDMHAALGLAQLSRLPDFITRRQAIAATYCAGLAGGPLELPAVPAGRTHVYFRFVVGCGDGARRDRLMDRLVARGVQCRRPVFKSLHRYLGLGGFPASDHADATALSIPLYPSLSDDEVARVIQAVREAAA